MFAQDQQPRAMCIHCLFTKLWKDWALPTTRSSLSCFLQAAPHLLLPLRCTERCLPKILPVWLVLEVLFWSVVLIFFWFQQLFFENCLLNQRARNFSKIAFRSSPKLAFFRWKYKTRGFFLGSNCWMFRIFTKKLTLALGVEEKSKKHHGGGGGVRSQNPTQPHLEYDSRKAYFFLPDSVFVCFGLSKKPRYHTFFAKTTKQLFLKKHVFHQD